ncbi:hypothetical protein BU52_10760 [Streptomyces toyocaensis]|uniref:Integrase n=1 Tax=Streptomyces toyocaensis TaxID=55952 RepID=A0A081XU46_STRTO|nr:recombinase family protein [Streptomyces toyocaensis]KES07069.1 hypothetical protein BU52_10760 [Streptomyces toyocaensis]
MSTPAPKRVLGILRLSRDGENSTSIERQREDIERWAEYRGHRIVGWVEDVNVSGSMAPWDRPSFSAWLPDTIGNLRASKAEQELAWNRSRAGEWDIMCAWKLDRFSRQVHHVTALERWCRDNGRMLATTDDGFDLTTESGRLLFNILAAFAEGELERIRARQRSSRRHLAKVGRYAGSTPPYGYRAEPAEDGEGFVLVPDETGVATAKIVRGMVRMILKEGKTANAVAEWLNKEGHPKAKDAQLMRKDKAPKGATWAGKDVSAILRSEVILGRSYHEVTRTNDEGETVKRTELVLAEDGVTPLQRAAALISEEDFTALQSKLDEKAVKRQANRLGRALLLGVVECECGRPWYRNPRTNPNHTAYRCSSYNKAGMGCGNSKSINANKLDALVTSRFLTAVGNAEIVRRVFVPGENHDKELTTIERRLTSLRKDRAAGLYDDDDEYAADVKPLLERRKELRSKPSTPDRWEEVPTGQTYAEKWATLTTDAERNAELITARVKVIVHREELPTVLPLVDLPEANADETEATMRAHFGRVAIVTPANMHRKVRAANG